MRGRIELKPDAGTITLADMSRFLDQARRMGADMDSLVDAKVSFSGKLRSLGVRYESPTKDNDEPF